MKFYKLSLIVMLPILFISTVLVLFGIQHTFKISESDNNIFYSEMTYKMLEEYINYQIDHTSNSIFTDKGFYQIRNELIYKSALENTDSSAFGKNAIRSLAAQYNFEYFYVENTDQAPFTNAPYELTMGFLVQDQKKYTTQTLFYEYENRLYIGILKNIYTSNSEDKSKSYLVMTPIEHKLNMTMMKSFIGIQDIEYVFTPPVQVTSSIHNKYDSNGIINIENDDFNQIFVPIRVDSKNSFYLSARIDKPEIINNLKKQTFFMLISVFFILLFASLIMSMILKKIAAQIDKMVKIIDRIANGHYDIDLEYNKIKELGQLSTSINKLSSTINDKIKELHDKNDETVNIMIEALDATDSYTKGHSDRVSKYVQLIGRALRYDDMDTLIKASLVHDIGKITIPEQILNKKGPLTDSEFKIIQEHSLTGFRILHKASAFNEIDQLVLCHHEKYDGTGYPQGLKGEQIPLGAQILSIADVYDALTSRRPYRKALSHAEAVHIITVSMRSQFSEKLLQVFMIVEPELEFIKQN
ncbi:HD-GYP domain-containing protein [Fusibacter ferrireducens]|uniref:HD domain-containing protein n=1 Tax=Fusibacter ferrireducens TaxID=2785058 RepID=A0ABR9ZPK5_9FIRM|nr:HD-GYP domain-containing protein [Fusibacter ferrireducens]MBF4691860.1 HD domain-containing protein [Fusibacter ferrireducens]